ncbi:ribonuclease H2 subunit B isoform X1 [Bufo gargarizans]|uniref:ribonuclease H2 subunit B isoform X1 n=1 Tax=Bufo gargarizans TaxID=30331 RepID=UPI001CF53D26|nr:ribonuclease H2 subunit B isoform X1 [Bufo gargarizans]
MPPRRKKPGDVPSDQWVLIAPDSLKDDAEKPSDKTLFAKLRSPLSDKGAMFLFISCGQQVCEVKVFQEEYRSWFIGQTVQEDGRLLYVTPVDPLFLVLYYLMKADKEQGKFQPVEQIVVDEEFPACSLLLQCTPVAQSLHHVTEEKEIGSKKFYKYSKEKTLAWLKKKVDQTVKVLKDSDVCVGGTTQSVSFIRVKQESHIQEEDYVRYAHGLVSEYISIQLRDELSTYLNLPEVSSPTPEPPTKKRKLSDKPVEAEEDYTKYNSNDKGKKANSKMSAAQKSLAKVDKSGMKNISSFFSPKSKATK